MAVRCPRRREQRSVRGPAHEELVRSQVRGGVVEDVAIAGSGRDGDDHRDHHPETDRREHRARPGAVAGKVAEGEPDRDGGSSTDAAKERQTARGEEDHRRDEHHEPEHELGRSGVAGAVAGAPCVREEGERDHEQPNSGECGAMDLSWRGRAPRRGRRRSRPSGAPAPAARRRRRWRRGRARPLRRPPPTAGRGPRSHGARSVRAVVDRRTTRRDRSPCRATRRRRR